MKQGVEAGSAASDVDVFPVDIAGLPSAEPPSAVDVAAGASFDLRIHPVVKEIGSESFRMLSYNGSIPGPTLRVKQGSEITVNVSNHTEMETTVHWHGLRLANRYDGVPHDTQAPIPPGGSYSHRLRFPDAGLFWYHPHMREDYAQEMGLYGNIIVEPIDPSYWPHADRELILTLDDILIEDGKIASFDPHHANFAAMGRFGNVLLISGELEQELEVTTGEIVRLHLTNTANTRVFKVRLPGRRMKLVGSDGGRYEHEEWIDDVVIAPSERAVVDVLFDEPGRDALEHVTPQRTYRLASIAVVDGRERNSSAAFDVLRVNDDMVEERHKALAYIDAAPDKTLVLVAEMDFDQPDEGSGVIYVCPMHPEVVSADAGSCPKCGMKLMPSQAAPETSPVMEHPAGAHSHHHDADALADGIEWEDQMVDLNRKTTPANMRWKIVDRETGKENAAIGWVFAAGDQVKISLVNEMASDHPMHHPFHVHGERFLILARDGVVEPNLVWKDTVLIRTGEVVDLLMDASNPGLWMAHCHIAEHMESGMMFTFRVLADPRDPP